MNEKRCSITYQLFTGNEKYSVAGLQLLSRHLHVFSDLPFTTKELYQEVASRSTKMSIQGVQPKLSAILNVKKGCFELVDRYGKFILKPELDQYPEIAANEDLTMRLASVVGIEVPLHGLVYNRDNTLTYFIKRFDRYGHKNKWAVEDFSQLSGQSRETKYQFSMEKLIPIIEKHCTFPAIVKHQFFVRILFNYLVGNEDMHLKNFSLITRRAIVELAPAYDFVNTTLLLPNAKEELALPLNGKKNNITFNDLVNYYAYERLSLSHPMVNETLTHFRKKMATMLNWVDISFLSEKMKKSYKEILVKRSEKMLMNR